MIVSGIELVPYTDDGRTISQLANEIRRCLAATPGSMQVDFPQVFSRYCSLWRAQKSVAENRAAMQDTGRGFGACTIEYNGEVIGVASYSQKTLHVPLADGQVSTVDGPMIAAWLSLPAVSERPTHMLPALLEHGARVLLGNHALLGTPWTVVNTSNRYVANALVGSQILGGFVQVGEEGVFEHIDGSRAKRCVFACASTLQDLRAVTL